MQKFCWIDVAHLDFGFAFFGCLIRKKTGPMLMRWIGACMYIFPTAVLPFWLQATAKMQ
jgi:hypothetical protein